MEISGFTQAELGLVLRALREVALVNDRFVTAEADLIEGIARLHDHPLTASELQPVTFDEVARGLTDPHRRKRAVQLAIVMSLVEGEPTPQGAEAVARFARALDVPEEGLKVLGEVAHGHALFARFDMVRRMNRFVRQSTGSSMLAVGLPALLGMNESEETARRFTALGELPQGSFGRAFYDHYRDHGFALPGEKSGVPENMIFHDVGHVVSGYGVDPENEIQQAAFQAGYMRRDGFLFLLFGILQFHIGIRLTPIAKAEQGYFDVRKVMKALERGSACKVDFSDHFDLFAHAAEPLAELRARWGVPPLEEQRLAS